DEATEQDLKETPFGVNETIGKPSEIKDVEGDEVEEKQANPQDESGSDVNKDKYGDSWEQGNQENNDETAQSSQFDPNPFRSLGDALKQWKEKLKIIENQRQQHQPKEEEQEIEEGNEYEYVHEDDA